MALSHAINSGTMPVTVPPTLEISSSRPAPKPRPTRPVKKETNKPNSADKSNTKPIADYEDETDYTPATVAGVGLILLLLWVSILMPLSATSNIPLIASEKLAWYLTRTSGTIAYLLLSASTIWGLILSTKVVKDIVPAPITMAMHNYLSWTSIGFTAFHAFVLLFDSYFTYTITDLLIPFTGPYSPFWVGIGTIGFYLMLLTSVSFYWRKTIGQKNWRKLHYLTFGVYIMGTLHGWMAGTDSSTLGPLYLFSGLVVIFLTAYRVVDASTK
ncbi:MAG: hypothetical protein AAF639_13800 [Chloroflexota bacterium]